MTTPWQKEGISFKAWCKKENTEKLSCSYCDGFSMVSVSTIKLHDNKTFNKHRCEKCSR